MHKCKEKLLLLKNKVINYVEEKPLAFVFSVIIFCFVLSTFIIAFKELHDRLSYELLEIASCDANLFYTVGKMMTKGYAPYTGYYENKPPMIFILSAASYGMTGGFHLVNIASFLCCLNLLIVPIVISIFLCRRYRLSLFPAILSTSLLFVLTLFLMFYAEHKAGSIMCELFGSSALLDSILCLVILSKEKNNKFYHPCIILAGLFFGIAIMFKEPFALLGIFSFLFLVENKKDLLNKVLFPIIYGGITSLIILLASGGFVGYFTVYLPTMFSTRGNKSESMWERGLIFKRLFDNLDNFSKYLMIAVIIAIFVSSLRGLTMFVEAKPLPSFISKVLRVFLPFVSLYIASLCVGMGGQYFWHHYAFALPFYYSLFIDASLFIGEETNKIVFYPLEKENKDNTIKQLSNPIPLLCIITSFSLLSIILTGVVKHDYNMREETMLNFVSKAKNDASYIDKVLDSLEEDNYLFIGFNSDDRPYCYTVHDPLGPCFVQDPDNYREYKAFFTDNFLNELHKTNVIVYFSLYTSNIREEVNKYLSDNFTNNPPSQVIDIKKPDNFKYTLYYRVNTF